MGFFGAFLFLSIVIFILFVCGRQEDSATLKHKSRPEISKPTLPKRKTVKQEARELASEIKTYQGYKNLEKEFEAKEKLFDDYMAGRNYDEYLDSDEFERVRAVLSEAVDMLGNKKFRYCCVIDTDEGLEITLDRLNMDGMKFPKEDFDSVKKLSHFNKKDWQALENGSEPEETSDEVLFLKKFRKIVENNSFSDEDIKTKIDDLVDNNRDVADSFFDLEKGEKPGEFWFRSFKK